MTNARATSWIERLDAVMDRLRALASRATGSPEALTDPDPETGERWEEGQVWSHMAEFIPYWLVRCRSIADEGQGEPVPFGRTTQDPERVAGIQLGREMPIRDLFTQVRAGAAEVRAWLEALPERAWESRAAHHTLGVLSLDQAIRQYLVGHMEDHAGQLEALVPSSGS